MNRVSIFTLSAGFLIAAFAAYWLTRGVRQPAAKHVRPEVQASVPGVDPGTLGVVLTQVANLKAEVQSLKARQDEKPAVRPASSAADDPGATPPEQPPLEYAAVAASYEAIFDAERTDTAWSIGEQRAISDLFARGVEGARLQKAECREDMCRVSIQFSTPAARQQFINAGIGQPPFDHGGFFHTDEATGDFTLFSAREGRTLPAVQ